MRNERHGGERAAKKRLRVCQLSNAGDARVRVRVRVRYELQSTLCLRLEEEKRRRGDQSIRDSCLSERAGGVVVVVVVRRSELPKPLDAFVRFSLRFSAPGRQITPTRYGWDVVG